MLPILHSSMSDSVGSIVGFFATSLKSKRSSRGASPRGILLSLDYNTSMSSFPEFMYSSVGFLNSLVSRFISAMREGS